MTFELIGALIATVFGCFTIFRKKTPLFYKIIFFSMLTCLMGNIYTWLYNLLWQSSDDGFHIGYLGYVGMFFFLYSSYYGAINNLADGKQPQFKRFRVIAGIVAATFFICSVLSMYFSDKKFWIYIVVIPMSFTIYFAMKLLIIPDIEMGIIKVMRPYNALIIGLCICMMLSILSVSGSMLETVSSICTGILLALCMPVARNGVRKWFI